MKYIVLIMCLLIDLNAYAAEMPAIAKDHCGGCHAVDKNLYAPSLKNIAMKYRGDVDTANKLTKNINQGGTFGWNTGFRMPARGLNGNDKEIEAMVEFIISLVPPVLISQQELCTMRYEPERWLYFQRGMSLK